MWVKIARLILRNKLVNLSLLGLLTIFMAYRGMDVRLSYEYANMLPKKDTVYKQYDYFKSIFGEEANVFVIGYRDTNYFEIKKFNELRKLTDTIKNIDGISGLLDIPHLMEIKKDSKAKKFIVESIFPDTIQSQQELDSLSSKVYDLPFYKNLLYNDTEKIFISAITFEKSLNNSKQRIAVVNKIKKSFDTFGKRYKLNIHYSGLPFIRSEISNKVQYEMKQFIFFALLITIVILYFFFRSIKVVLFSLVIVFVSIVWVLGTMGLFHYKITILSAMLPPLIIVISIPNIIYLLNHYFLEYKSHKNKIKALQRTIHKTGNTIFITNVTTAAGFGTFIITNSKILQEFGILAFINIIGLFILTIIIIPTFYSFIGPPKAKHIKHLDSKFSVWFLNFLSKVTIRFRRWIYLSVAVIIIIAAIGISKMNILGYIVDDIPHHDQVYVDLKFFEKYFHGVMPIEIMIDTEKKKGVLNLKNIRKIDKLQQRLATYPELSRPISYADVVKFSKQAYYNGNPAFYKVPTSMEKNFILSYASKAKDSKNLVKSFIDSTKQSARISIQVADIGTKKMKPLVENIRMEIDSIFSPEKYKTIITGMSVIYMVGMHYLINNLFISVFLAILLIAIFMSLLFGSFRMVLISLAPNVIPLLLTAGMMGFFGVPLKPSTILVFSIAFGISVDDTIHFLTRYRQELRFNDWNISESVSKALNNVGVSMLHTSIILFFGFS
ncbi:MAG TPA: RND family transporter, partial [Bacteroidales bacterium]|nr:RND family transporter [Bacteroidales bacterium]